MTDTAGRSATTSQSVTITAGTSQPLASFVYSPSSPVSAQTTVTFDASASQAPQNGTISRYEWRFGEDGGPVFTNTTPTILHSYQFGGTYTITLTVFDNQGGSNSTTRQITVLPTASFTFSPTDPTATITTVSYNGSASQASGGGSIISYQWAFGDGFGLTSGSPFATHTYLSEGTFTITLVVTDNSGRQARADRNITVKALPAPLAPVKGPAPIK